MGERDEREGELNVRVREDERGRKERGNILEERRKEE